MYPNACLSQWKQHSHHESIMSTLCMSMLLSLWPHANDRLNMLVCVWSRVTVQSRLHAHPLGVHVGYVRDIIHRLSWHDHMHTIDKHDIMLAHPPNLSILISGGKCTTLNAFSHCEWTRIKSQLETMIRALNCCICMYCHFGYGCKLFATSSNWGWQPRMRPAHKTYGVHCSSNVPLDWNANGC